MCLMPDAPAQARELVNTQQIMAIVVLFYSASPSKYPTKCIYLRAAQVTQGLCLWPTQCFRKNCKDLFKNYENAYSFKQGGDTPNP